MAANILPEVSPTPMPAKIAANERIVSGLASVSRNVEA
jgi:hypothetical protein